MRFLFNDSGIKILTYPEVEFAKEKPWIKTKLFNYQGKIMTRDLFNN